MVISGKDLLGLKDKSKDYIEEIISTAVEMKKILMQNVKKTPHLAGKSVVMLFYENSTRTSLSFDAAGKFMSASTFNFSVSNSSVAKGESLVDTAKTIEALLADVVVMRHSVSGAPHLVAKNVKASVINAGDGMNEHPTQALLDLLTIKEKFGNNLKGLKVVISGDIKHSRVARSNIFCLSKYGADITVVGPKTLLPIGFENLGVKVTSDVDAACDKANIIMGLRLQLERQKAGLFPSVAEYSKFYGLNSNRIAKSDKDAIIMHPGPMNRGLEISSELADSGRSVILDQVTNGLAVRMAILFLLTRSAETK